jgi:hypothetical protein
MNPASKRNPFNESELQRLKEELEGYLPQTWPIDGHIENRLERRAIPESRALLVPSELSQLGERLVAALEVLRRTPFPQLQPPAPAPVSIADIAHKIMLTLPEAAALAGLSRALAASRSQRIIEGKTGTRLAYQTRRSGCVCKRTLMVVDMLLQWRSRASFRRACCLQKKMR